MFLLGIMGLFLAVIMACLMHMTNMMEMIDQHRAVLDKQYVAITTEAFQMRLRRAGDLGTMTLTNIQATDEGFRARSVDSARIMMVSALNIPSQSNSWYFDRLLIYALDKDNQALSDPAAIKLAANNICDASAGFNTASTWCGPRAGITYGLIETQQIYQSMLTEEVMRMQATLNKLARAYKNKFMSGGIAVGSSVQFCSMPGNAIGDAGCSPTACTGTLTVDAVPLDCADLLTIWGNASVYNYISPKHVALVSNASNVRVSSAGATRKIARELRTP